MEKVYIYAVSDSVGDTAEQVAKSVMRQFDGIDFELKRISYINDRKSIDNLIELASKNNSFIVFTIVIEDLKDYLIKQANDNNIKVVDVITPLIIPLINQLGLKPKRVPGLLRKLDERYFNKINNIEFAVKYDDGKNINGLIKADIVLIGISRTSKTPLSLYLANKNLKVANLPLVPELSPPEELFNIPQHKIIGLVAGADHLNKIRKERLKSLGLMDTSNYASVNRIDMELEYSKKIMDKINCKVIDISDKAIEETADIIISHYERLKKNEI